MFEKIPNTVSIKKFISNYKSFIDNVSITRDPLIITINAVPSCVLISVRDYNKLIDRQREVEIYEKVQDGLKWEKERDQREKELQKLDEAAGDEEFRDYLDDYSQGHCVKLKAESINQSI